MGEQKVILGQEASDMVSFWYNYTVGVASIMLRFKGGRGR